MEFDERVAEDGSAVINKEPTKLIAIPAVLEAAGWVRKKEWVGLTDEEIDHLDEANWEDDHTIWGPKEFARAIEAKLKEKNGW